MSTNDRFPARLSPPTSPAGADPTGVGESLDWEAIFDGLADAVTIHDSHFNIVRANASARALLGLAPNILEPQTKCFRWYHGADAPPADCPSCRCFETGEPGVSEVFEPHLNRYLEVRAFPRVDARGASIGLVHVVRDITDRKRTGDQIAQTVSLLESTLDATADGILLVDGRGGIVRFNERFREMWRIPQEVIDAHDDNRAIGFVLDQLKDPESFVRTTRELYDRPDASSSDVLEFKDGRVFERDSRPQRIGPEIVGRVWSFRDVTARRRAEAERGRFQAQLQQIQKMESVGRLAGGVAHDFNNMLSVILGHAEVALDALPADDPIRADLKEIHGAAERSANLTRQLLAFARRQPVAPVVLDLNETIAGTLRMLRRLIGEDIELSWQPGDGVPPVKMDAGQLDQILANLCVNARDAIGGVGFVAISTSYVAVDELYCASRPGLAPGQYVQLSVSDTGCGMALETQAHLFEPFFTTKAPGSGTGLGLATVYGIVKQNEGFIDVYSETGQGSTFTIYLPAVHGESSEARPERDESQDRRGHETVLIVEDEPAILKLNARTLEGLGYRVLAAGTPADALALATAHEGAIHLLLTDVVMPEMNGQQLWQRISTMFPDAKCLFSSGYTADVIVHRGVLQEGVHFIQKPSSRKLLAAKVREVLDGV